MNYITLASIAVSAAAVIVAIFSFRSTRQVGMQNATTAEESLMTARQRLLIETAYQTAEEAERRMADMRAEVVRMGQALAGMQDEIKRLKATMDEQRETHERETADRERSHRLEVNLRDQTIGALTVKVDSLETELGRIKAGQG